LTLQDEEEITNVLRVVEFDGESAVFFATRKGVVKKTPLEAFSRPKKGGIWAIKLEDDDAVVGVGLCNPGDTVLLGTAQGRAMRFDEAAARSMGRTARGVRGIRLKEGDRVVGMVVNADGKSILTATAQGYGKRTALEDYPIKGRGGQGVINIRCSDRNGEVIGVRGCSEGDDVMFITASGMIVRTKVSDISSIGRNTQGVRLINLKEKGGVEDQLVAAEVVSEADIEKYTVSVGEDGEVQQPEAEATSEDVAQADPDTAADATTDDPPASDSAAEDSDEDEDQE
jgi:DNA gyrase subunit A